MEKKKSMAPILKAMKLYDKEVYSLDDYYSLNAAITSVQTINSGMKFTRKRNNAERTVTVIRTA